MDDQQEQQQPIKRQVRIPAGSLRGNKYSGEAGGLPLPTPPVQPYKNELMVILRSIPIWTVLMFLSAFLLFSLIIATWLLIAKGW